MPKKQLFDDDEAEEPVDTAFKVNRAYADKFDVEKRKKELQKLASKYGDVDSDDSESEDDDDAVHMSIAKDRGLAAVLKTIRSGDISKLKDPNAKFYDSDDDDDDDSGSDSDDAGKGKKFTLKDEYQRGVQLEAAGAFDEEEKPGHKGARTKAERSAKAAFLDAARDVDTSAAEFAVKQAPKLSATEKLPQRRKNGKGGADLFEGAELDDKTAFLKGFFENEAWRADGEGAASKYTWEQQAADEQDEAFFDDVEQWEQEWQQSKYRHEEGDEALKIQTFARQQDGLLRAKDTRRKDARERKAEREEEEELRATEELKRLKNLKKREIDDFRRKIAETAGIKSKEEKKLAAMAEMMQGDYDPEAFDKQMAQLFDDDYYGGADEDEIAAMENELDAELDPQAAVGKMKAAPAADTDDDDDDDLLYPTMSINAAIAKSDAQNTAPVPDDDAPEPPETDLAELEKELDKKIDEYWRLHYHKNGKMRTRFQYREVNPEHFGFDDTDVLALDDRTLNMVAPLNCYSAYLTKNQNTADRYKALHRKKNLRLLPAERKSRRYSKDTVALDPNLPQEEGEAIAQRVHAAAQRTGAADAQPKRQRSADGRPQAAAEGGAPRQHEKRNRSEQQAPRGRGQGAPRHNQGRGGHSQRPPHKPSKPE